MDTPVRVTLLGSPLNSRIASSSVFSATSSISGSRHHLPSGHWGKTTMQGKREGSLLMAGPSPW